LLYNGIFFIDRCRTTAGDQKDTKKRYQHGFWHYVGFVLK